MVREFKSDVVDWVTKEGVARRQIREAILLFFEERDPIAVHVLVASGHQVLVDIARHRGIYSVLKPPTADKEYIGRINFAINFMKHADKDPKGRINLGPLSEFSADCLMDAVRLLQALTNDLPVEAKVYWSWYTGTRREEFEGSGEALKQIMDIGLSEWDFRSIRQFLDFAEIANEHMPASPSKEKADG